MANQYKMTYKNCSLLRYDAALLVCDVLKVTLSFELSTAT